ncbi:MAG TPA: alkaline phosphatase family protein [Acidimicrobiia bacterium]|nr:alkaline phosphatase family protein [Acidimicrobiia bacterium]
MRVVLLVLDAFDPVRLSPRLTPNLWGWSNTDGAVAGTGQAVMASCTYPNHATFITGQPPAAHGIYTNHVVRDGKVLGAWEVGPAAPSLFEVLNGHGTEAVLGDHHLVGVMKARAADRHWPPDGDVTLVDHVDLLGYPSDEAVLAPLLKALEGDAGFVVGYFGSIDTYSHVYGPASDEAANAYQLIDEKLGVIAGVIKGRWDDTVLIVVSDHVQDTVAGPGIDLHSALGDDVLVIDEGSAALISGSVDIDVLSAIDGLQGWEGHPDGTILAWCGPGRYFGRSEEPVFLGIHGGTHTRTQMALVSGGNPARLPLAAALREGAVPATFWANAIKQLML